MMIANLQEDYNKMGDLHSTQDFAKGRNTMFGLMYSCVSQDVATQAADVKSSIIIHIFLYKGLCSMIDVVQK